jgi:hypothetical protein
MSESKHSEVKQDVPVISNGQLEIATRILQQTELYSGAEVRSTLQKAVRDLVHCYQDNSSLLFWKPLDTVALEVALQNRILGALDAEEAIADLSNYEFLLADLGSWFEALVCAKSQEAYTSALNSKIEGLSEAQLRVLVSTLKAAVELMWLDPDDDGALKNSLHTSDDDALYSLCLAARGCEKKPGYARVRIHNALEAVSTTLLGNQKEEPALI